ncbi:MAG TPA: ferritin family protein [Bacillota bacterium]|nr:ferritin family protein [Bacillota bacterium]
MEQAMQMEKDGELFYRELAEKATVIGFREIFNQLADDEVKHYQVFKTMRQKQQGLFPETQVLKKAANIFKQMIAREAMNNLDPSQLELYRKAMELERNSQNYYLARAAEKADDKEQSELFRKIAGEEERHYFLLHNIYELVLRPQTWVENGEFVHLEEY